MFVAGDNWLYRASPSVLSDRPKVRKSRTCEAPETGGRFPEELYVDLLGTLIYAYEQAHVAMPALTSKRFADRRPEPRPGRLLQAPSRLLPPPDGHGLSSIDQGSGRGCAGHGSSGRQIDGGQRPG